MPKPKLTLFCELDSSALTELFDDRFVIDDLKNLEASLSLGILDLSDERAQIVKRLNQAGVPVVAWLLLPKEDGYWFNADNTEKAASRYLQFKAWTREHGLKWVGVGLDIEMDINEVKNILESKPQPGLASKLFKRYLDKKHAAHAQRTYQELVALIRADGYPVEAYHIPLIVDERQARSTVLQRTTGLVDLETDREVLMLYSSFLRPDGDAVLWSYAPQADSVGVGSTGGGVQVEGIIDVPPLTWDEFSRDLRLCIIRDKPVHIFSLEGCVRQGFLSKLNTFDWDKPVAIPASIRKVHLIRTGLTAGLWILERPWVILISLAALIGLRCLFKRNQQ